MTAGKHTIRSRYARDDMTPQWAAETGVARALGRAERLKEAGEEHPLTRPDVLAVLERWGAIIEDLLVDATPEEREKELANLFPARTGSTALAPMPAGTPITQLFSSH